MKGSKQCCVDSLKQMLYDWMEDNRHILLLGGELDMLKWAVWLQKWVELNNREDTLNFRTPDGDMFTFFTVEEDDDAEEEKKTDFDADRK